jgi:hypothetical protein
MRTAWVILLVLAGALSGLGQDLGALLDKAPPDIEEALRSRVSKFYQLHVENKYRAAESYVAEDSKDLFYGMDKPRCKSFALGSIKYSDNFTHAKVMIACDTEMMMITGRIPVKMPVLSLWKVDEGQWCWYAEPVGDREIVTPFGIHKPTPEGTEGAAPANIQSKFVELSTVSALVRLDKREVQFTPTAAAEARVVITNGMPGSVTLTLQTVQAPGLTYALDRTSLETGETAILLVRYTPVEGRRPSASAAKIMVAPTNQELSVNIGFSGAAEPPAKRRR